MPIPLQPLPRPVRGFFVADSRRTSILVLLQPLGPLAVTAAGRHQSLSRDERRWMTGSGADLD
jgi:hypothetical protein